MSRRSWEGFADLSLPRQKELKTRFPANVKDWVNRVNLGKIAHAAICSTWFGNPTQWFNSRVTTRSAEGTIPSESTRPSAKPFERRQQFLKLRGVLKFSSAVASNKWASVVLGSLITSWALPLMIKRDSHSLWTRLSNEMTSIEYSRQRPMCLIRFPETKPWNSNPSPWYKAT